MSTRREVYTLTYDNIDLISNIALEEMTEEGVSQDHQIKTRFSMEEVLLRFREHFGEGASIAVSLTKRFGREHIEVRLSGEAYNPLRFSESVYEEWDQMLSYSDFQPDYYYTGRTNVVRWPVPVRRRHPVVVFTIAIALGLLLGFAGRAAGGGGPFLDPVVTILGTVEEIWIRLLNVLCGPVIFLLIITTVLNMDTITRQGGSTGRFLRRVFSVSLISSLAGVLACFLFLPVLEFGGFRNFTSDFTFLILQLIPEDAVTPFASTNVPQLLLLGVVIGSAMIASGRKYDVVSDFIHEANRIGLYITGWLSSTAPFFLCIMLAYEILRSNTEIYAGIWKPVLILIFVAALIMLCSDLLVARTQEFSFKALFRVLMDPFVKTLVSGSADPVFDNTLRVCHEKLGIDKRYAETGLSIGLIMFMPVTAAGTIIFVLYTATIYNVKTTFTWYIICIVVSIAMSVAVPPVPGVGILTYVVLFAQLGIPAKALIAAMVFDVITNVFISAANQLLLQLELVMSAGRMAMLDRSCLRSQK